MVSIYMQEKQRSKKTQNYCHPNILVYKMNSAVQEKASCRGLRNVLCTTALCTSGVGSLQMRDMISIPPTSSQAAFSSLVSVEAVLECKECIAGCTFEGPYSCMCGQVRCKVMFPVEACTTDITTEWTLLNKHWVVSLRYHLERIRCWADFLTALHRSRKDCMCICVCKKEENNVTVCLQDDELHIRTPNPIHLPPHFGRCGNNQSQLQNWEKQQKHVHVARMKCHSDVFTRSRQLT